MSIQHEAQPPHSRWLTEEVFKLIDMVRSDEAIYNSRHKYYFCRPYVENFWREVDLRLGKNPGASLAKWTNLRISFRREYTNYQEEKVPPCWSYFDKMLFLHPFLRNKKQSGPKDVDCHLQEALAQITNINCKPQQRTNISPVNEYVENYLSYCEEDVHASPGMEDLIEEDDENETTTIRNEIKSECDNDNEEKRSSQEHDEYKDIIVEISDDNQSQTNASALDLKRERECNSISRTLLKRCRTEQNLNTSTNIVPSATNISFVRPLTMAPISTDANFFHDSITNSLHASSSNHLSTAMESPTRRHNLCDCKTDSDAMFLMSLLPDIRKLHGRDRGKIKIAFQNILQEFLYPD